MKKLIALLLVFAVFSTTVFAAPLSLVTSLGNEFPVKTETSQELDLFADVGATQLTDMEASAVEGEGLLGALLGFVFGAYTLYKGVSNGYDPFFVWAFSAGMMFGFALF